MKQMLEKNNKIRQKQMEQKATPSAATEEASASFRQPDP